ncbi:MAG TPA: alpha/beta hydrolase [Gemmataceae bacterium]|jgi:acetyl esterase/lipase|nr:alpha/beta hydrolase [Gemmataceae bacterium]
MNLPLFLALAAFVPAADPKTDQLWLKGAPGHVDGDKDRPNLTIFLPPADKANGCAVVVCPGGGYGALAEGHEGKDIAKWLNERGVAAFMLRYRIVQKDRPGPLHPYPLMDAQRAIRTVRARAKEFGIDPARVGIWGFSAGGHLASTAVTHFDAGKNDGDEIDKVSCRPDFGILCYPVITFTQDSMHRGSRNNLIGAKPDEDLVKYYSNELQVTKDTPPIFLFHTEEDRDVPPANSRLFEEACKKAGVPVTLVIFEKGPHGVGLAPNDPVLSKWPENLEAWMKERGVLEKK